MNIRVLRNQLIFQGKTYRCAVGRGGIIPAERKTEGDGGTPTGRFLLRECWVRLDRIAMPKTSLPKRVIAQEDGWCDDPTHADYNRHVTLPHPARCEHLWREDHAYDLMIPLGYNDAPPIAPRGSAIFLHAAHDDYRPTEGCVALKLLDLQEILPALTLTTWMEVAE